MFSKSGFDYLYNTLIKNGFKESKMFLDQQMKISQKFDTVEHFYRFIENLKVNHCDKENLNEVVDIVALIELLILKYDFNFYIKDFCDTTLYFYSKINRKYSIVLCFENRTNCYSLDGISGNNTITFEWGYEKRKKSKTIILKKNQKEIS